MRERESTDALSDLIDEHRAWLTVERGRSANTIAAYGRDLRRYARFLRNRGIHDAAEVDSRTVSAFVDYLRALVDEDGHRELSDATIARTLVAVRSLHRFAVSEGLAGQDPTDELVAPRTARGLPKGLTVDEVESVLVAVPGDTPRALRDRAILETLYASGVRISELIALDRDDVDLALGLIRVTGKGRKERVVPIGRAARDAIDNYLVRGRPVLADRGDGSSAVFLNHRGGRLGRQGCWSVVREAGDRAGVGERLTPHVLRHSCATHLLEGGADIRVVQELLGHASISTTQVYTMVTSEHLRSAYDAAHPRARISAPPVGSAGGVG